MSKTRTILRVISSEEIDGKIIYHCEKVLQGKKWWMFKWHDCYKRRLEPDEDEFYPIKTEKSLSDEEWKTMRNGDKYVWVFFDCFPVKL